MSDADKQAHLSGTHHSEMGKMVFFRWTYLFRKMGLSKRWVRKMGKMGDNLILELMFSPNCRKNICFR